MATTFLYFAYGSNLLAERIHVNNPSGVFKTIGKLKGYQLCFNGDSNDLWRGAGADIQEKEDSEVWGVVWELNIEHLESLDRQEVVSAKVYRPIEVNIETEDLGVLQCRSYQQCRGRYVNPKPSTQYLDIIITGAIQHGLPAQYIEKLKSVEHTGDSDSHELYDDIMRKYRENKNKL